MTMAILRFNFAAPHDDPAVRRNRINAALELGSWSETRGVSAVSIDEHHQSGHGWSCNPIMTAAVFLARTERVVASVDCALAPLWHPVRLAEDIAMADTIGGGRLIVTLGLGYRPVEYELFARPFEDRGRLMDELLETLMSLWSSPSFTPGPLTRPHPTVFIGGSVRATARRAARYGLPLNLPSHLPDLADYYRELCAQAGHTPVVLMPPPRSRGMVFLHEDPDRAWVELGEHYLWEARVYSGWGDGRVHSFMHGTEAPENLRTVDDVKAAGRYRFMTPEQLIADVTENPHDLIVLHPLVGAMPVEEAWKSVQLLTDEVLPALKER
jgi:alkanesulfonate monooxygenase SsuD/methylene tetrahydromethanopterin reductase-like flavin-dependent oxidoreductase (luciferase family)